jgi:predicted permease
MKAGGRSLTAGRERFGLRQALVVSQVALSLVLLVGALLFSGSLRNLMAVNAGFDRSGLLITHMYLDRIPPERRPAFRRELTERVKAASGVDSVAETGIVPLSGGGTDNDVWPEGSDSSRKVNSNFNSVSGGYFKTIGMVLLSGRDFDDRDTTSSPRVAIVNESLARRLSLGPEVVGKRFRREATPSEPEVSFEVVGLVKDTKYHNLREAFTPIAFLAHSQDQAPDWLVQALIRSRRPLVEVTSSVRTAVAGLDPTVTVDFRGFDTMVREGMLRERLMATLSTFFGMLAALIAAIGLYGVMSYLVARRTNEIGIRIALGADGRRVLALVMSESARLLGIGLAAGTALALAVGRTAESMLFGVTPGDSRTLLAAIGLLAAVTAAASYLPARRAARLEPMAALREE